MYRSIRSHAMMSVSLSLLLGLAACGAAPEGTTPEQRVAEAQPASRTYTIVESTTALSSGAFAGPIKCWDCNETPAGFQCQAIPCPGGKPPANGETIDTTAAPPAEALSGSITPDETKRFCLQCIDGKCWEIPCPPPNGGNQ